MMTEEDLQKAIIDPHVERQRNRKRVRKWSIVVDVVFAIFLAAVAVISFYKNTDAVGGWVVALFIHVSRSVMAHIDQKQFWELHATLLNAMRALKMQSHAVDEANKAFFHMQTMNMEKRSSRH